ncbi:CRISPR-associated helicase/endonuclease Cas3 [Methanobrevibacter boviskoreani]|uniref:CRISPR-associated helicase/endonuclease Cas3 n=1 Tax=Methanobrevibacter boviskoreani TaxID=1348249 RepID=UPI0005926C77|nr:CRISPR-associated helicase/endonuclease Cas3 [Methanobrevibacter boviskoreani]
MDFFDLKYDFDSSFIKLNDDFFYFYAHTNEYLMNHIQKTSYIFDNLLDKKTIEDFYERFKQKYLINFTFEDFNKVIKYTVYLHDIGKISFNFQLNRLNKNNEKIFNEQSTFLKKYSFEDYIPLLCKTHSIVGSLIFLSKFKTIIDENTVILLILAYTIYGHHTSIKDILSNKHFSYDLNDSEWITFCIILLYLDLASKEDIENEKFSPYYFNQIQDNNSKYLKNEIEDYDSTLSYFYMYIYSLLIVSDVFASNKYNISVEEVKKLNFNNRITLDLKNKMFSSFYNKKYNKNLSYDNLITDSLENIDNINVLRKNMLLESSFNLIKSLDKNRVFFLNMPTGAGKTNTSMKLALDIINNTEIDRIIYAMPFINIIEQNFDVICDSYGLTEDNGEIRKIYSGSETLFSDASDEFKYDILLNDDFFNYPVICTTFVSLFNSIIRNDKKSKYKLFALTNSVIILDEIQSLPLKNWNSLYYIINELADKYNIYFIIMSATLPNFNRLILDSKSNLRYPNISLIENPSIYFNHSLFKRTEIKNEIKSFELTSENHTEIIDYLLDIVEENFEQDYNKGLMVFNTIKSSRLIYDYLSEYCDEYNFEIDLLNSSLIPSSKKAIISKINHMNENQNKKYILISTQSIEAGVDVSFDFVIRDYAILDSIEQIRGRCNRNGELTIRYDNPSKKGNVYLIKLNDSKKDYYEYIYNDEEQETRIKSTGNLIEKSANYTFEDISDYYDNVSDLINLHNNENESKFNFIDRDNIIFLNNAEYSKLLDKETGIHLIDNNQEQFSIFICTDLNIFTESLKIEENFNIWKKLEDNNFIEFYKENKKDFIFSINELRYIKYISSKTNKKLYHENKIIGKNLLEYYKSLFKNRNKNHDYYKLIKKEFSSILYKFMINITINKYDQLYEKINEWDKFKFFYILDEENIGDGEEFFYSLNKGFNFKPIITEIL